MRKFSLMALCFLLVSCLKGDVYDSLDTDFPDNRWMAGSTRNFEFDIPQAGQYDLSVRFSHVAGFQFRQVPLTVLLTDPDGNVMPYPLVLEITDAAGKDNGDCVGDVCDLEFTLEKGRSMAPGLYTAAIQHNFPNTFLPNVLGIGLHVMTSKTK